MTVYQLPRSRTYNEPREMRQVVVVVVCHRPTDNVTPAGNNERYTETQQRIQSVSTVPTGVNTVTLEQDLLLKLQCSPVIIPAALHTISRIYYKRQTS
jgi:hypothetical protein